MTLKKKNQRGMGGVGFLGIIAALLAVMYLATRMMSEQAKNGGITAKERLESAGVKLPENTNSNNAADIGKAMAKDIENNTNAATSNLKCSIGNSADDPDCSKK